MSLSRPKYIVVHTAAYTGANCDRDVIDRWHRDKGWQGIGYHYVIINDKHDNLPDGKIQEGRGLNTRGAHTKGLNSQSIGICCVGHGDIDPFTANQSESLIKIISDMIDDFDDLTVESVIGHREINRLVAEGIVAKGYRTSKTCPGKRVEMNELREEIRAFRQREDVIAVPEKSDPIDDDELRKAIDILEHSPSSAFPNAQGELREFLYHPEVISFRSERPDSGITGRPDS